MVFGIYCRKSVVSHKGESVENQQEMCRDYIYRKFGRDNEIIVYEDEGYSGKNTARPMFIKLNEDIRRKKLDYVVCYRLDRMSRSVSDFSALVEMMNRYKTGLICIKEEFDTSKPMGKAMMYIASVFSQLERETIGERVKDNMLLLARDGRWLGGNTPLGYDTVRIPYEAENGRIKYAVYLKENGKLVIPEKIFEIFLKYKSAPKTAEILNREGIKTGRGGEFTPVAVRDIIANPVYCRADMNAFSYFLNRGIAVFGEYSDNGIIAYNKGDRANMVCAVGHHMPAVIGELWTAAQSVLEESIVQRSVYTGTSLASGAIICGICGGKMYAVKRSGNKCYDYICENKRKKLGCSCRNLCGTWADSEILRWTNSDDKDLFTRLEIRDCIKIVWNGTELFINKKERTC